MNEPFKRSAETGLSLELVERQRNIKFSPLHRSQYFPSVSRKVASGITSNEGLRVPNNEEIQRS